MNWIVNKLFFRNSIIKFNYRILSPIILLCVLSLFLLKSTSYDSNLFQSTFGRQIVWLALGSILFFIMQFFRIQFFNEYAYHLYFLLILGIITTYFMPIKGGSQRWIFLGPLSFQPSEIGKVILVFVLAKFLSDRHENVYQPKVLFLTILIAFFPAVMVFKQPDLGTALVYLAITYPMLYWSGIRPYYLFIFIAPLLAF